MQEKNEIRDKLSQESLLNFDDIVLSRVLGANRHIQLIGEIMLECSKRVDINNEEKVQLILKVAAYFKETRGQQSRAIYNAIQQMTVYNENDESTVILEEIKKQIENYEKNAKKNLDKLIEYAVNITENMNTIMIFDYSSTVNEFIKKLKNKKTIYIPESRALDGGKPYVKAAVESGHDVHFIADTTMFVALKNCQAVFMGAETIYPDGTIFNTIGSDIVAILCEHMRLPLYVLSPLVKVDDRPLHGYIRLSPMPFNYENRLTVGWSLKEKEGIDFQGFKLLEIESQYIKAIICEKGIIPSKAFFQIAMEYVNKNKGVQSYE